MNIEDLLIGFENLSNFGVTLNSEKRLMIYNSLVVLRGDAHYNKVHLWGIVRGLIADYFIAYGYQKDPFTRTFYYSLTGLDWVLLPEAKAEDLLYTRSCSARFQGDPKFVTQVDIDDSSITSLIKKPSPEEITELAVEHEQEEFDFIKGEGKIKEEDRLAAVVYLINQEAVVVPRGGLYKRHDGVVVDNQAFEGLSLLEGDELRSYLHFREPQQKWNTNILSRHDYNYGVDFLDTIDLDKPEGLWVMRLFDGNKTIILQQLAWPGYIFCHLASTPFYFSFYVGNGKKNLDIPFML